MKTEMIKIFGNEKDAERIRELIEGCLQAVPADIRPVSVFLDKSSGESPLMLDDCEYAVIRSCDRDKLPDKVKAINYEIGDPGADVCALNMQPRENRQSFEILYESFMGRIFVPNDSEITQLQILVAVTVLFFMDADCDKVLRVMNELLN